MILGFIVILSILVIIHELGHYFTAKFFGIKVEEFGIGFPPRAFGIKRGETIYSINWLPIGGFVKLYGEDEAGGGSIKRSAKSEPSKDIHRAFFSKPAWQRALVVFAGVVMNFILAVVIISYLFAVPGVVVPTGKIEIVKVSPNTPAAAINLKKGDDIISFNDKELKTFSDLSSTLAKNKGKKGKLVINRNGSNITYEIAPQKMTVEKPKRTYYGIGVELSDSERLKYPWYQAPFYGTIQVAKFSWLILTGLGGIVGNLATKGQVPTDAAGPIGIAQIIGEAIKRGVNDVLWIAAVLSLNLAVINVLPIPALDGGRLFFILIELVTGKKVPQKYESVAHAVGLAFLLGLILLITFFDISRIIDGKSIIPGM